MNGDNLDTKQQVIIETLGELGTASTTELKQHDDITDLYEHTNSINRALSHLEDTGYLTAEAGNPKTWELADKGQREYDRLTQSATTALMYGDDETQAEEVFRDYFQHAAEDDLLNARIGKGHIYLDYEKLEQFDAELADALMTAPEDMIDACEDALLQYLAVEEDDIEVRIRNVPEVYQKSISELSANDLNQLVTVQGVIQSGSAPKLQLTRATFRCEQCGKTYTRSQDGDLKSPYKCGQCGNKRFTDINTTYETVRYLHIKEQPDRQSRDEMVVVVRGNLAVDERQNLKATGSGISITGYLEPYKAKKSADAADVRLVANNVEVQEDKWADIDITDDDIDRIQEIAESNSARERLVKSLAADEVKHAELLKETALIWLLGRTADGNIHVLVFGEPGTGKSAIGRYITDNFPKTIRSVATGATGVGLTASVTKDKLTGEWVAEAGSLAMADGGYHLTDEIDKLTDSEDISNLNDALSEGTISLDKANIHTELSADVSEFAIGNPDGSTLNPHEEAWKQVPIDDSKSDLKDRFDIFICVRDNDLTDDTEREREREIIRHMIRRNHFDGDAATETDEPDIDLIDENLLIKYVAYAQELEPTLTPEAAELLEDVYFTLNQPEDDTNKRLLGRRDTMSLKKIAIAYARLSLSETVTEEHVQAANQFVRRAYDSMDFEIGEDSLKDVEQADTATLEEISALIADVAGGDDHAPIDDVVEEADYPDAKVEDAIERLKREGEIFEPKPGHVKTM